MKIYSNASFLCLLLIFWGIRSGASEMSSFLSTFSLNTPVLVPHHFLTLIPAATPYTQGWIGEQWHEWKKNEWVATDRRNRELESDSMHKRRSERRRQIISALSRYALWPRSVWAMSSCPAVPQDAQRHLHKTWGSLWDRHSRLPLQLLLLFALWSVNLSITTTRQGYWTNTKHAFALHVQWP